MTSSFQSDVARTSPSNQIRKGEETVRSILRRSLITVPALLLVLALSSAATAEDGPPVVGMGGEIYMHSLQGVGNTPQDAEQKALDSVNAFLHQNGACAISVTKTFDWVVVNGIEQARCTIAFQYYHSPLWW